ncbi:MAG: hypothetical protein HKN56_06605 [Gammaproteobacteria bacterium]|nr:hypothetical protein [Gammaproteobacteria bacterium]NND54625.1 hypothetical protein [Gammaproteobacteria bacterium]
MADWFAREPAPLSGFRGIAGSQAQGTQVLAAVQTEGGRVAKLAFRAFACPHIIAACHLLADRLAGESVEALVDPALPERLQELEIPVEKAGKILILQDALRACYDASIEA